MHIALERHSRKEKGNRKGGEKSIERSKMQNFKEVEDFLVWKELIRGSRTKKRRKWTSFHIL
jgi:hypothetical protein